MDFLLFQSHEYRGFTQCTISAILFSRSLTFSRNSLHFLFSASESSHATSDIWTMTYFCFERYMESTCVFHKAIEESLFNRSLFLFSPTGIHLISIKIFLFPDMRRLWLAEFRVSFCGALSEQSSFPFFGYCIFFSISVLAWKFLIKCSAMCALIYFPLFTWITPQVRYINISYSICSLLAMCSYSIANDP